MKAALIFTMLIVGYLLAGQVANFFAGTPILAGAAIPLVTLAGSESCSGAFSLKVHVEHYGRFAVILNDML